MGWYEAIKDAVDVARKADNIDLVRKLLDAQIEAMRLIEENSELKKRIKDLEASRILAESLVFKKKSYFLKTEDGEDGPDRSVCWDCDRRLVRKAPTQSADANEADGRQYICGYCNSGARRTP